MDLFQDVSFGSQKKIIFKWLLFLVLLSFYILHNGHLTFASTDTIVTFQDTNLETAIREALNKSTGDITQGDLSKLTSLDAKNRGIRYLSGLEHATNLTSLDLSNNQIENISQIEGLIKLQTINLGNNKILDVSPLKNLASSENNTLMFASTTTTSSSSLIVSLENNNISDVAPLLNLTNLYELDLSGNKIGEDDLTNLKKLNNVLTDSAILDLSFNPLIQTHIDGLRTDITKANIFFDRVVVKLNKSALTLAVGDTETLSATITVEPEPGKKNQRNHEYKLPIFWTSSDPSVLTVSSDKGETTLITAIKAGKATVKAVTPFVDPFKFAYAEAKVEVVEKVIPSTATVNEGDNVEVNLDIGSKFIFDNVIKGGDIFVIESSPELELSSEYRLVSGSSYEIWTTSTYSDFVVVTLPYNEDDVVGDENKLRLLHFGDNGWEDITKDIDPVDNTITGITSSFSPFVIVEGLGPYNIEILQSIDNQPDGGVDFNANLTGSGVDFQNNASEVIKSDGMTSVDGTQTQRTHGEYHNNTNSCASCHQTHTGASKSLLFKDGVYNTCSACHDGTLGFYNVFEIHSALGSAGTFGGTNAGNMSVHLAIGAITLRSAPGGNLEGDGSWKNEFNCASCHSPHGSYSDRLLHYNPNGMGIKPKNQGGIGAYGAPVVEPSPTGIEITDAEVMAEVSALPTLKYDNDGNPIYPNFVVVKGTKASLGVTNDLITGTDDVIVVVYNKSTDKWTDAVSYSKTMSPWLYGYEYGSSYKGYWTRFYTTQTPPIFFDNSGKETRVYGDADESVVVDKYDGVHFEYSKGYAWGAALANVQSADIGRAYVVKLDLMPKWDPEVNDTLVVNGKYDSGEEEKFGDLVITTVNQRALYAGEISPFMTNRERWGVTTGDKVEGWGVAMSDYCAACHTDYLAASGSATGTWNQAYRHSTDSDSFTCVRCHFAHGTDVKIMRDAQNKTAQDLVDEGTFADLATAEAYLLDKNPSSALKRYTNMSVCWACHTEYKAEKLKNTDSYYDNGNEPHGLVDTEGKSNWPKQ